MSILLRELRPDDVGYVLATWSLSVWPKRSVETGTRRASRDSLRAMAKALIQLGARGIVACDLAHESTIHGWGVAHGGIVLHIYVPPQLEAAGLRELRSSIERHLVNE